MMILNDPYISVQSDIFYRMSKKNTTGILSAVYDLSEEAPYQVPGMYAVMLLRFPLFGAMHGTSSCRYHTHVPAGIILFALRRVYLARCTTWATFFLCFMHTMFFPIQNFLNFPKTAFCIFAAPSPVPPFQTGRSIDFKAQVVRGFPQDNFVITAGVPNKAV